MFLIMTISWTDAFPMIPICCIFCQAKCEMMKDSGTHTCTCPDGFAGDGTICFGSILDVSRWMSQWVFVPVLSLGEI